MQLMGLFSERISLCSHTRVRNLFFRRRINLGASKSCCRARCGSREGIAKMWLYCFKYAYSQGGICGQSAFLHLPSAFTLRRRACWWHGEKGSKFLVVLLIVFLLQLALRRLSLPSCAYRGVILSLGVFGDQLTETELSSCSVRPLLNLTYRGKLFRLMLEIPQTRMKVFHSILGFLSVVKDKAVWW